MDIKMVKSATAKKAKLSPELAVPKLAANDLDRTRFKATQPAAPQLISPPPLVVKAPSSPKATTSMISNVAAKLPHPIRTATSYIRKHYLEYPLVAVILLGVITPALSSPLERLKSDRYKLDSASSLLTATPKSLTKNISYDTKNAAYTFTPPADQQGPPTSANSQSAGGVKYSATLNSDAKKGITLTDTANKLGISLTPNFDTLAAKKMDNHIVYPLSGNDAQLVYTFKGNGLKEDIVLYSSDTSEASFSYTLKLPTALKAKLQQDGSIGIYGGDSSLYGNISYGSDKDKALVEKARANSAKNTLMYVIPAPTVKASNSKITKVKASFSLKDNQLTVHAINLTGANYPFTIDPSLALASTSDFQQGNNDDGNIDFSVAGQISRGGLSGGSVGAWGSQLTAGGVGAQVTLVNNGYLYVVGGVDGTYSNRVQYAVINGDGSFGAFTQTSTFTNGRYFHGAVVVSNHLYVLGGISNGVINNDVQFATLNADGSLGMFAATNSFPTARFSFGFAAAAGYIYLAGGCTNGGFAVGNIGTGCAAYESTSYYARPNADGTISGAGSWIAGPNLPSGIANTAGFVYNNRFYIAGGTTTGNSASNAVYFADISSGAIGGWAASTTALYAALLGHGVGVVNGRAYVVGGNNGAVSATVKSYSFDASGNLTGLTSQSDLPQGIYLGSLAASATRLYMTGGVYNNGSYSPNVYYAAPDVSGNIASWTTSATLLPANHSYASAVVTGGRLYLAGGGLGHFVEVMSAAISGSGSFSGWREELQMINSRGTSPTLVAYDGYLFAYGGSLTVVATESTKINPDGSLAGWRNTSSLPTARAQAGGVVYAGYLYLMGGLTPDTVGNKLVNDSYYAKINGDGTIGAWTATTAFTTKRYVFGATAVNGYLYLAGGCTDTIPNPGTCQVSLSDTQYAKINSDGSLGAWQVGTALPTANYFTTTSAANGYLYLTGYAATSYYAPIYASGSLGAWQALTNVPNLLIGASLVSSNGYLFDIGGANSNSNGYISGAYVAKVDPAGALGVPQTTTAFPDSRGFSAAVVYNGFLYVSGGCTAGCNTLTPTTLNTTKYAAINAAGTLGSWSSATNNFGVGIYVHTMSAYNGYLYVTGGINSLASGLNTVQYAPVAQTGDISAAWTTSTNTMSTKRFYHASAVSNGFIYVTGGNNGTVTAGTLTNTVEYAPLNSDGSVGTWVSATPFATPRDDHGTVIANGKLYVIGGYSNLTDVQYATIASNGALTTQTCPNSSVATWCTTTSLLEGRQGMTVGANNGFLYVVGGATDASGSTFRDDVMYASINSNGSLGSFTTNTAHLSTLRAIHVGAIYGGYVYVTTGCVAGTISNCTSYTIASESMQINNGGSGTTTAWTTANPINARKAHATLAVNGYLYSLGGLCSSGLYCTLSITGEVQYAAIDPATGAVGAWAVASNGIIARANFASWVYGGRLYVAGGCSTANCSSYTRTIQYVSPSAATGNITSAWTTNASNLPSDNQGVNMIPYNDYLYRVAGNVNAAGSTSSTEYTTIGAATGVVGGSWTAGTSTNVTLASNKLAINNGYIYTLSGITGASESADVEYSQIQADHSLGTWIKSNSLPQPRQAGAAVINNGYIYYSGGYRGGAGRLSDTQYAPLLSGGGVGNWQATTSLNIAKADIDGTVVNGRLYTTGGSDNSAAPLTDVEYTSLAVISRTARYSKLFNTDKDVTPVNMFQNSTNNNGLSISYQQATQASPIFSSSLATMFTPNSPTALATTQGSYFLFNFVLDDSQNASFPDVNSSPTTLSYFKLNYHPNSSLRLRGGKTFNSNATDRSLDAP
jgi:hypothetical protein